MRSSTYPSTRGLIVSFVYDVYATTPGTEYTFEGVFRFGHRDSHGSLCRSPDAQHCT